MSSKVLSAAPWTDRVILAAALGGLLAAGHVPVWAQNSAPAAAPAATPAIRPAAPAAPAFPNPPAATTQPSPVGSFAPATRALYTARLADNAAGRFTGMSASPLIGGGFVPILDTVVQWDRLRRDNYNASFAEYAGFLMANPQFPLGITIRRLAERKVDQTVPAADRIAFFRRFPPQSAIAKLRLAEALLDTGRAAEATAMARDAWDSGGLDAAGERELLARFETVLTPADHLGRANKLLWSNQITAAGRLLPKLDMDRRLWLLARIGTRANAPDASNRLAGVPVALRREIGLINDEALWLRRRGRNAEAEALLIGAIPSPGSVTDAQGWMSTRLDFARVAWRAGNFSRAYDLASRHNSFAPSEAIASRSLAERQVFVETEWLAGWLALRKLGRAADAVAHFQNVRAAALTPLTQSRGDYWTGRANEAAGRAPQARVAYEAAAAHIDYFYGQLATERLNRRFVLRRPAPLVLDANAVGTLRATPLARAATALGQIGDHARQTIFLRALVAQAETVQDLAMVASLAAPLARLDLGVLAGKEARSNASRGLEGLALIDASYPRMPLPAYLQSRATIIHAITRQESQFDREARSPANALGMMQLLPATAAETAGKIGYEANTARLTTDPLYNVTLGSTYYYRMRDAFGSDVLAVASYNAGPGNARKMIARNGDPRLPDADIVDWIESIPIAETRNYVQRVLENAVMYEMLLEPTPATAASVPAALLPPAPLSRWLAKDEPG